MNDIQTIREKKELLDLSIKAKNHIEKKNVLKILEITKNEFIPYVDEISKITKINNDLLIEFLNDFIELFSSNMSKINDKYK